MDRKKALKAQYKQSRPDMGVFMIRSKVSGKALIEPAADLKSAINRSRFQLNATMHANRELQTDWQAQGADNFEIEVLDKLEYDKDPAKTDYTEDLEELLTLWKERLAREGVSFYGDPGNA